MEIAKTAAFPGNRILCLYAFSFVHRAWILHLTIGVVQTPDANSASTEYLEKTLGLTVEMVEPEDLRHTAAKYDIGIYADKRSCFVAFSPRAIDKIQQHADNNETKEAARFLQDIQGMSTASRIMRCLDQSKLRIAFQMWNNMYTDVPSKRDIVHGIGIKSLWRTNVRMPLRRLVKVNPRRKCVLRQTDATTMYVYVESDTLSDVDAFFAIVMRRIQRHVLINM